MYYRIRFKAGSEEFVFEELRAKHFVMVSDVIRTVKDHFKIEQADILILDENYSRVLAETETIEHARTYIVKRIPSSNIICNRKRKRKVILPK